MPSVTKHTDGTAVCQPLEVVLVEGMMWEQRGFAPTPLAVCQHCKKPVRQEVGK